MKKLIMIAALACIAVSGLTACNDDDNNGTYTPTAEEQAQAAHDAQCRAQGKDSGCILDVPVCTEPNCNAAP